MARNSGAHEIILALNGRFADSVDRIRRQFRGLIEPGNVRVWYPSPFAASRSPGSQRAGERLYEAFLASLQPDVVFISSLFEGQGDASVTSVGSFVALPTAITLYDLIPLLHPKPYLDNPATRSWYMRKIDALRRADAWFAISESSRLEGVTHLGLDPLRCINVSAAAYDHFRQLAIAPEREQALRRKYGLHKPFVMYTGGIDPRKNLDGLISAFAMLPANLSASHQLAIVCSANAEERATLLRLARDKQLSELDVVVTGFVPEDDLVALYNLCDLFVFPSWHEGFGLPALEAMHCGAVVIGADTSSVPEVIGSDEALFDPHSEAAIAAKMVRGLTDADFRARRVAHGLAHARSFSWEASARRAIEGLERLHASAPMRQPIARRQGPRPRLAYVSPLPPERSGIAGYSKDLLPELARYYEIDLVTPLERLGDPLLEAAFPVRSIEWFRQHAQVFDRVLYHFGNSEFHAHMFDLLAEIPGTTVLHDFFLSGARAHQEFSEGGGFEWTRALHESHGYAAVAERFQSADPAEFVFRYPCNFDVLAQSQGVIVHSPHSKELAKRWFGESVARDWALIPLLRAPPTDVEGDRVRARAELGLSSDDFLVCAFGLMGPTKLNHRLIDAWLASALASDGRCRLVFVGEHDASVYGRKLAHALQGQVTAARIEVTGWASDELFARYLAAADVAVQLRTQSRGETSAAVLDAIGRGLATIVNANGSMAFLPRDAVVMLPDEFIDEDLSGALERLWLNADARHAVGASGRQIIRSGHAPAACAEAYANAIEAFAANAATARNGLLAAIEASDPLSERTSDGNEILDLAEAIAAALPLPMPKHQLFVDVSELAQRDARSGIQRVVKSLLKALLDDPPAGYAVEPVYAVAGAGAGYRYARAFTLKFMGCPAEALEDAAIDIRRGDVFVGLDLQPHLVPQQAAFYQRLRHAGVRVEFVVYDLLPIALSHRFTEGAAEIHATWLRTVAQADGALCISAAVAGELSAWMAVNAPERLADGFKIRSFHLGADPARSTTSKGLPEDAENMLRSMSAGIAFLMVGTLEPRKGYDLTLDAFDRLWADGAGPFLVIVGAQGWMVEDVATRLKRHPQLGKRLFWLKHVSDEYLERLYAAASCLVAASEGEGFGLPLIEAAKHGLPIMAADIPVFREVAGEHALFFDRTPAALAAAVREWIALFEQGTHPASDAMPYLDWQQSAEQFEAALLEPAASIRGGSRPLPLD